MNKFRIGQKLSLSLFLIILSNILTGIENNEGFFDFLFKAGLLTILTLPLLIIKKELHKNILSWILLILSVPTLIDNNISNLTGCFIFLFSISIAQKSKKAYMIYLSIFIVSLLYKFNILHSTPSQIIGYIGGLSFIGIFYQHYIHPKSQSKQYKINYLEFPSKKYLLDVMQLYIQDKTWDEIAGILYPHKTGNSLRKDVKRDINKLEFGSYAEFVLYLGQNGIIKAIDKNVIT